MTPRVTVEDVGTYWVRDDGSLWVLITFAEHPTVTWERIDVEPVEREPARPRRGGVVGSPITEGFVRLVRDDHEGAA